MVGASAGGGTDVIARMLAEHFGESLKQTFVVENRPGASNTIAADLTAKAPADGHTLLLATNTGQAIAPHIIKLGFDPLKDLQPVGLVVVVPNVLLVNTSVPAGRVGELVKLMKEKPGSFRYASSGVGSTQHLAGEASTCAAGHQEHPHPVQGQQPGASRLDRRPGRDDVRHDLVVDAAHQVRQAQAAGGDVAEALRAAARCPDAGRSRPTRASR